LVGATEITIINLTVAVIIYAITALNRLISAEAAGVCEAFIDGPITVIIDGITDLFEWLAVRHTEDLTVDTGFYTTSADPRLSGRANLVSGAAINIGLVRTSVAVIIDTITDVSLSIRCADEVITEISDTVAIIIDLIWVLDINAVVTGITDAIHVKISLIRVRDERTVVFTCTEIIFIFVEETDSTK
jgi:hypothetical protein